MKKHLLALSMLLATGSAFATADTANNDTVTIYNNTSTTLGVTSTFTGADILNINGKLSCKGVPMLDHPYPICASIAPTPYGVSIDAHSSKTFTVISRMTGQALPIHGAVGFIIDTNTPGADLHVTLPVDINPFGTDITPKSNPDSAGKNYHIGAFTNSLQTENPAFIASVTYYSDNGSDSTTIIVNDNPLAKAS